MVWLACHSMRTGRCCEAVEVLVDESGALVGSDGDAAFARSLLRQWSARVMACLLICSCAGAAMLGLGAAGLHPSGPLTDAGLWVGIVALSLMVVVCMVEAAIEEDGPLVSPADRGSDEGSLQEIRNEDDR
jgi:hypothetical protein